MAQPASPTQQHWLEHPHEEYIRNAFVADFTFLSASRETIEGLPYSVYLLAPRPETAQSLALDLDSGILAMLVPQTSEPDISFELLENLLANPKYAAKANQTRAFLISDDQNIHQHAERYMTEHPDAPLIATFQTDALHRDRIYGDEVSRQVAAQIGRRDLFDQREPLLEDRYFFGRRPILAELQDTCLTGGLRGLFGMRKMGKTSVFRRLERQLRRHRNTVFCFVNCRPESIHKLHAEELLAHLAIQVHTNLEADIGNRRKSHRRQYDNLATNPAHKARLDRLRFAQRNPISNSHAGHTLLDDAFGIATLFGPVAIVLDEVEFLTGYSQLPHWAGADFGQFWRALLEARSKYTGKIAIILGGVNPALIEMRTYNKQQNPLFGLVPITYLRGMNIAEIRSMLKKLGDLMDIRFQNGNNDSIFRNLRDQYGGHPLMIRLACSYIHKKLDEAQRPHRVSLGMLEQTTEQRDAEISFLSYSIVDELKDNFSIEYELLEAVATGEDLTVLYEFFLDSEATKHLLGYGVLSMDGGRPSIPIRPIERMLRQGKKRSIVPVEEREAWRKARVEAIHRAITQFEGAIKHLNRRQRRESESLSPLPYGATGYRDPLKFIYETKVVTDHETFQRFCSISHQLLLESMDAYAEEILKEVRMRDRRMEFRRRIEEQYGAFWFALCRIQAYRNATHHEETVLRESSREEYERFLTEDLEGKRPDDVVDGWFTLQQRMLDELLLALLIENEKIRGRV